jgi:hypothetical protein
MLKDLAWLPYVGIAGTAMVRMAVIAIVVYQDHRDTAAVAALVCPSQHLDRGGHGSGQFRRVRAHGPHGLERDTGVVDALRIVLHLMVAMRTEAQSEAILQPSVG